MIPELYKIALGFFKKSTTKVDSIIDSGKVEVFAGLVFWLFFSISQITITSEI